MRGDQLRNVGCVLVAISALATPVWADTISYHTAVTFSHGIFEGIVPRGAPMEISYTLERSADHDTLPEAPETGFFPASVTNLTVSFPSVGLSVNAGRSGSTSTNNNVVDQTTGRVSDQVTFTGGPIMSSNLPIDETFEISVVFLSEFVDPPAEPFMIDSDELPFFRLSPNDPFVLVETASGLSSVQFTVLNFPSDDGCTIRASDRTGKIGAWMLLLPALMLWSAGRLSRHV